MHPAPSAPASHVIDDVGGVVSPGGALSNSSKSSIVTDPIALSPMPIETFVAPAGIAGLVHVAFDQVDVAGNEAEDQNVHTPAEDR
jgi:hypothetical protein